MNRSLLQPLLRTSPKHIFLDTGKLHPSDIFRQVHRFSQRRNLAHAQAHRQSPRTTPQRSPTLSSLYRSLRLRIRLPGTGRPLKGQRAYSTQKPPSPDPTPHLGSPEPQGFSARLKKLSREYGWTAVGVYFALSALDFPFCFLAVRLIGVERVGHAEQVIVSYFWRAVESVAPGHGRSKAAEEAALDSTDAAVREGGPGWGVEEAEKANSAEDASIWTQLALAYAIHKSFIFIRVPLTAAVLPKVVKTLRGWGWNIGKRSKSSS